MADDVYSASGVAQEVLREFAAICLKNSEYDYTQGGHGGDYVDIDALDGVNRPITLELFSCLVEKIKSKHRDDPLDAIAFIERDTGPVGLLGARVYIAQATGLPTIIVRPRKRIGRFAIKAGAPLKPGFKVALVTDVSNTGRAIRQAAEPILQMGGHIAVAISLVDRSDGAKQYLQSMDVNLEPVTTLPEVKAAMGN